MLSTYRLEPYFQALELDPASTLEEARQAYHDLVLVWHPDRFIHNPRLQQKAEEKVKFLNQAYQQLKIFYTQTATEARQESPATPPTQSQAKSQKQPTSTTPPPAWSCPTTGSFSISFGKAQYIVKQYRFKSVRSPQRSFQCYEGGPFRLLVSYAPLEFQLSVPCDSLQSFDRILLSIPCKSTGKFWHSDAQILIKLLQQHLAS
jgi:DnaJ domain